MIWEKKLSTLSWVSFTSYHAQRCIQVCFPMLVDWGFALGRGGLYFWEGGVQFMGTLWKAHSLQGAIYYSPKTPAKPGSLKPSALLSPKYPVLLVANFPVYTLTQGLHQWWSPLPLLPHSSAPSLCFHHTWWVLPCLPSTKFYCNV